MTLASRRKWPSIQRQPRIPRIISRFILRAVNEVPSLHEMTAQIIHNLTMNAHANIRPSHTRSRSPIKLVLVPRGVPRSQNSTILIVLSWIYGLSWACRVEIRKSLLVCIPVPECQVESTQEGHSAIDQAELFILRPRNRIGRVVCVA